MHLLKKFFLVNLVILNAACSKIVGTNIGGTQEGPTQSKTSQCPTLEEIQELYYQVHEEMSALDISQQNITEKQFALMAGIAIQKTLDLSEEQSLELFSAMLKHFNGNQDLQALTKADIDKLSFCK